MAKTLQSKLSPRQAPYEREYCEAALSAVGELLDKMPNIFSPGTAQKIRLALSLLHDGDPGVDELAAVLGHNWVIARKTKNIVTRYGEDVNCISAAQLHEASETALLMRFCDDRGHYIGKRAA